jgi:hypothetical protein
MEEGYAQAYTIPSTYFDPDLATQNLVKIHQRIDYGFENSDSREVLYQIFRKMNDNLADLKSVLRLDSERCINLLQSIVGTEEDIVTTLASLELEQSILADPAQISLLQDVAANTKTLRGFIERDNRYVKVPGSMNPADRAKLLEIASQTCADNVIGMATYLRRAREEHLKKQERSQCEVDDLRRYFQQKRVERDQERRK